MNQALPTQAPPTLGRVAQLLLICSRPTLSDALQVTLRQIVAETLDWKALLASAQRNFVVVLLRKHLLAYAADLLPAAVADELSQLRKRSTMRAMEVMRIQSLLASEILAKPAVAHVFIKGATLAQEYYGDAFLRQYRDVDVLLEAGALLRVAKELIARGYAISNPEWTKFSDGNLAAFCRYTCALELRSPTGVMVELHRTLDNTGCVFSSKHYLAVARPSTLTNESLSVLPSAELYVYICFHHSRHRWESLHWCADLHAFSQHPQHDPTRAARLAHRFGMGVTLGECEKLKRDLDVLALHGELPHSHACSRLLAECLEALRNSITPPSEAAMPALAEGLAEPDFRHPWQKTFGYRWRFQWSRLRPTANDYIAWPLPLHWHWLYSVLKPIRVLRSHWASAAATPS
ncbi:MAG: nucleotidyltransferase family protein [Pseudomarimonas sp.]